jgi:hypothetical protein
MLYPYHLSDAMVKTLMKVMVIEMQQLMPRLEQGILMLGVDRGLKSEQDQWTLLDCCFGVPLFDAEANSQ